MRVRPEWDFLLLGSSGVEMSWHKLTRSLAQGMNLSSERWIYYVPAREALRFEDVAWGKEDRAVERLLDLKLFTAGKTPSSSSTSQS